MIRPLFNTLGAVSLVALAWSGVAGAQPAPSAPVRAEAANGPRDTAVESRGEATAGVIEGRVLDNDGRPVPGLDVVLTGRGLAERAVTDLSSAAFRFEGLPAGGYLLVSGTADGVAHARAFVTLDKKGPARVDLRLELGFSDAVTVTGSREAQLKRETPATVGTVTPKT